MKKTFLFFGTITLIFFLAGCGNNKGGVIAEHPDKEQTDTIVYENVKTGQWDTMFVKKAIKWNSEKNKYDTTEVTSK